MSVVNWFRAMFTIDAKNMELSWPNAIFIYLWRFVVMGFLAKWALKVWLGIDLPFFFDTGHIYTVSKYPNELYIGCVIFFGLCGVLMTGAVTFWASLAAILMAFGVFDGIKNWFMMLFAFLILGVAQLIFNITGRIKNEKRGIF